jgi:TrmH family RNA methyltransferase
VITSPHNAKLKDLRRLARKADRSERGLFAAEGEDLLAAADDAGWHPVERFAAAGSGLAGDEVEPAVLARASSLGSGTRAIGVYEQRWSAPAGPLAVALWGVGDPGNIGTVIRSALAFGAASVILGPRCADPFSPKAVRASMGAIFHVPVARVDGVQDVPGPRIALVARAGEPLPAVGAERREGTIVVGAEREGLPEDVVAACDVVAHIPIRSESLNAAMAATVALYELSRPWEPRRGRHMAPPTPPRVQPA